MFTPADPKQSFPKLEEQILAYWKEHNIFKRSLENRKDAKEYSFYDGPPFATGTPHYGHLLGGMLKDVMPRYQTMRGHYVERRFGWDCHGLPIENLVEKKLGISGKRDIEDKIGISAFNEACRENIFTYVDVWRQTVERMGRWVDMDDDYKTMDPDFMESVWWVFKSVFDKGLIYESRRVVHYCPRCSTPLSNFEVNQGYADKQDKAVTVKFKLKDQEKFILAWTTTPWTLPANLGLAVGEDIDYVELRDVASGEIYILASECISTYYKKEEEYAIERTMKGKDLLGLAYEPIIPDVQEHADLGTLLHDAELGSNVYHVIAGHHVTTDSGTGIVHIAPAFGEDDFIIGERGSLGFFAHIDAVGNTQGLLEDNGVFVFEYNDIVIRKLKEQKKIIHIGTIDHSYPFCYRCDTPLIFRAIPSWYLAVEKIKDRMIANNVQIRWIPDNIKHGRFGKWLEGARDWNISRNRYWGTPLPVWKNEDGELLVIGSMKELFEYNRPFGDISEKNGAYFFAKTGAPLDLHKHFMDEIRLSKNGKTYTRIPEVLDCWFESGSMPYCQKHYPFENKERFEKTFPADFIAEGLDQTRGWFYTLLILGTALFDKPPFLNVIVNGIILAEDGKKMSKRLKNYPDPDALMSKHGADAIRFYMLNSPVVKADDLRFSERGVEETVKSLLLPLWNTLSFFTTYANIDGFVPDMTEVSFVRHGEVDHNRDNRLADGNIDPDLNATGIEQAKKLAMDLRNSASSFDVIISSPQIRARHTAEIIAQQLGYQDEIRIEEWLREQRAGVYSGLLFSEIKRIHQEKTSLDHSPNVIWKNNDEENITQLESRVLATYDAILERYRGKKILIVSHGGVFRPINRRTFGLSIDEAYYQVPSLANASMTKVPPYSLANPLDRWIFSRSQALVRDVTLAFESYDLQLVTRLIVEAMDDLSNWYLRRSRRRFWKSEDRTDKDMAYQTLFDTLLTFAHILAPVTPFITEAVYRILTDKQSIHLNMYPRFESRFIFEEQNRDMALCQKMVSLGLAARAAKKIRVRQPLASITISEPLSSYYHDIIRDELNVKEVRFEEAQKFARAVCKPNARLLGPKFGKSVQEIIRLAKEGKFLTLDDGKIQVGEAVLLPEEYELAYEPLMTDNHHDVLGGFGTVIALDTEISESLKLEGLARDIIRVIQDARKKAGYQVSDRVDVCISGEGIEAILSQYRSFIENETFSIVVPALDGADITVSETIDERGFTFSVKKK